MRRTYRNTRFTKILPFIILPTIILPFLPFGAVSIQAGAVSWDP